MQHFVNNQKQCNNILSTYFGRRMYDKITRMSHGFTEKKKLINKAHIIVVRETDASELYQSYKVVNRPDKVEQTEEKVQIWNE